MAACWAEVAARLLPVVSALTRPWAVGGVGLSFTVQLSQESFDGEQEKMWAGSPVACGGQCRLNPECGAFAFNATEVPNCVLFVRQTRSSPGLPGLYYRGMSLTNGDYLFRLPPPTPIDKCSMSLALCQGLGLRLVQVQPVLKDLVVVQSQGNVWYDLMRANENATFTTLTGGAVNTSIFKMVDTDRSYMAPQCIASNYYWPYRVNCTSEFIWSKATVCQYSHP
ncbi:uncharacterized protein LOC125179049 [Hyalella azteca]|uniref:Uncharacterized protein LOC125179049 n=1 Tax=Hyalella azteca TaxID=294128 RepID=A0A979FVG9_HYAAZ|nr:uncharacterized protein LOC125179049 [Hyalella azteca]